MSEKFSCLVLSLVLSLTVIFVSGCYDHGDVDIKSSASEVVIQPQANTDGSNSLQPIGNGDGDAVIAAPSMNSAADDEPGDWSGYPTLKMLSVNSHLVFDQPLNRNKFYSATISLKDDEQVLSEPLAFVYQSTVEPIGFDSDYSYRLYFSPLYRTFSPNAIYSVEETQTVIPLLESPKNFVIDVVVYSYDTEDKSQNKQLAYHTQEPFPFTYVPASWQDATTSLTAGGDEILTIDVPVTAIDLPVQRKFPVMVSSINEVMSSNPITIEHATTRDNVLTLTVSYLGGCGEHNFSLNIEDGIDPDMYQALNTSLVDESDDTCTTQQMAAIDFDFSSVIQHYDQMNHQLLYYVNLVGIGGFSLDPEAFTLLATLRFNTAQQFENQNFCLDDAAKNFLPRSESSQSGNDDGCGLLATFKTDGVLDITIDSYHLSGEYGIESDGYSLYADIEYLGMQYFTLSDDGRTLTHITPSLYNAGELSLLQ